MAVQCTRWNAQGKTSKPNNVILFLRQQKQKPEKNYITNNLRVFRVHKRALIAGRGICCFSICPPGRSFTNEPPLRIPNRSTNNSPREYMSRIDRHRRRHRFRFCFQTAAAVAAAPRDR